MIGIYKITSPSGKVYIGQSWNIEKRRQTYSVLRCKSQPKLYNSLVKHGFENHDFTVLEFWEECTQEILDDGEIYFMHHYSKLGKELLNVKCGGSYGKHSPETIAKMIGKKHTEESLEKMRGRKQSPETIAKKVLALTGKKRPQYIIEKMRLANKGKVYSAERREKIKIAVNMFCHTDEYRQKISLAGKGKVRSEESKLRYSAASKGNKRRLGARTKNPMFTDEQIRSIREELKNRKYGDIKVVVQKYGTTKKVIHDIIHEHTYKYVI